MLAVPPPPADLPALIEQCAPGVGVNSMHALIATESGGSPWALNDNDGTLSRQPLSKAEAVATAKALIAAGHRVDMGLTQVDSQNLGALHLTVEQILEPCTNIAAGAAILANSYRLAAGKYGEGQQALLAAFSAYNTGRLTAGFYNGYVDRIVAHRGVRVQFKIPRLSDGAIVVGRREAIRVTAGGRLSPYRAPLAAVGWGEAPAARLQKTSPASAPLAVAGF